MRFVAWLAAASLAAQDGASVYREFCASCHDSGAERMPTRAALGQLSRDAILRSLETGAMKAHAKDIPPRSRRDVAAFLSSKSGVESYAANGPCADSAAPFVPASGPAWKLWGNDISNTRFQPAAAAGLDAAAVPKLKLKWAFALPGQLAARSQAAVAGGRLFVAGTEGAVFSLDARTGCRHWSFQAEAQMRGSPAIAETAAGPLAVFTDAATNVYAVHGGSGKLVWKKKVGEHPTAVLTATPQVHEGVLYLGVSSAEEMFARNAGYPCCSFRGAVIALRAADGERLWRTFTIASEAKPGKPKKSGAAMLGPSGAGVWITPTIDPAKGRLYVATGDNFSDPTTNTSDAVIALELKTGRIVWSRQLQANDAYNASCHSPGRENCPEANGPDHDFGQPPILVSRGGAKRALVLGQKSGMVHAVDPDNEGEVLWQTRAGAGGVLGGIQWGSAVEGDRMFVAVSDLTFAGPGKLDPNRGGGLVALRVSTGEKLWEAKPAPCGDRPKCSPAQSAAVTAIPGAVFSASMDGHLRAYSTRDGRVLWDFDTAREFDTVNGVKARGGSIDAHGPVVVGGMVYTSSGYAMWGGMPGNVLLAFGVE